MNEDALPPPATSNSTLHTVAWMIGQLLMNFGILDQLVFNVLQNELPEQDYAPMKKWHLTDRVERMIELLNAKDESKAHQEQLKLWHEAFFPARDLRNHLVHGYLLLTASPERKTVYLRIRQARDWDENAGEGVSEIGFDELNQCFERLNALITQLQTWAGFESETQSKLHCSSTPSGQIEDEFE